jgi:hypothetical protein
MSFDVSCMRLNMISEVGFVGQPLLAVSAKSCRTNRDGQEWLSYENFHSAMMVVDFEDSV